MLQSIGNHNIELIVMLKRKVYRKLVQWKTQHPKKALCIIGARQIGKTTIVRQFAADNYDYFVEINFLLDKKAPRVKKSSIRKMNLWNCWI